MVTVFNQCGMRIGNLLLFNDRELRVVDKIIKGELTKADLQCFCYILNEFLKGKRPIEITHIMLHYSTGISERQVSRSTSHLAKIGILKRERIGNEKYKYWVDKELLIGSGQPDNSGIPNIYIINILKDIIAPAKNVHPRFIAYFKELYEERMNTACPFNWGHHGRIVSALLEDYSYDQLTDFAKRFFDMDSDFIKKAGRHIGVFKSQIPAIIEQINQDKKHNQPKRPDVPII